jgi:hypothetical protein
VLLGAVGCAHRSALAPDDGLLRPEVEPGSRPGGVPVVRAGNPLGLRLARHADEIVAANSKLIRNDCSGFVETVYRDLGLHVPERDIDGNSVKREYLGFSDKQSLGNNRPLPGDLAFFDNTWDRNKNGKVDDPLTHVAIVTAVDDDGTITLAHYGGHGLTHFKMNLAQVHVGKLHGKRLNDFLRVQRRRDPPGTLYLSGELFAGLGRAPEAMPSIASR